MNHLRRTILGAGTLLAATRSMSLPGALAHNLTAVQVIERIKARVGIPWGDKTVDRIVAGDGRVSVQGVAVTMMATFAALKQAVAEGCNLVITHEPTFYSHEDDTSTLRADPTYVSKSHFIELHQLVVFRFHDHWHAMHPDGIDSGMLRQLGWQKNVQGDNLWRFAFSPTPLHRFAAMMAEKLGAHSMRVIGEPTLKIRQVAANWGYADFKSDFRQVIADPSIELIIVGEAREWEVIEFVQDQIADGQKKALIVIGHVASEQAGMKYCAEWLARAVSEVPVKFIANDEPFWSMTFARHE